MNRLVDICAPRGAFDFALKLLGLLLAIGALNWLRDTLDGDAESMGFFINTRDAAFVGAPFVILALLLIGHLAKLQRQLITLAATDMLTGLPNRRAFIDRISEAGRLRDAGTFLMIDLDHFKRINDSFGHQVGDLCLCAAATFICEAARDPITCAGLGGEEFGIFVPENGSDVGPLSDRLAAGLTVDAGRNGLIALTMSIGVLTAGGGEPLGLVMARADAALYAAKADGRARATIWTPRIDAVPVVRTG
ncbi:MAG: GGDEF domain-containing protein [Alphaproteobacteria bacterium]|nr:GGDEF domain-containing protein [Alphaproteobacteria bacterium]